jgi:flavin-binding protein dodecin
MTDHIYKHIEVTGSSKVSSDDAIRAAISKAAETIRGMRWFPVIETRGYIDGSAVQYWQVTVKIGFTVDS